MRTSSKRIIGLGILSLVVCFCLAPTAAGAISNGLVAYWDFSVFNASDPAYDATPYNGASIVPGGKLGSAASFDRAQSQYLRTSASPFTQGSHTYAAWYYLDIADIGNTTDRYFLLEASNGTTYPASYGLRDLTPLGTPDEGQVFTDTVLAAPNFSFSAISNQAWHYLVVTYDAVTTGTFTGYLDGAYVGQMTPGGLLDPSTYLVIGGHRANTGRNWHGLIDELAVWNRVLTAPEIAWLYNSGAGNPVLTSNVSITPLSLDLDEAGVQTATYEVVCTKAPEPNVLIIIDPNNDLGTGLPIDIKLNNAAPGKRITLFFDAGNWDTPQTVTVTAIDDSRWNLPGEYDPDVPHTVIIEHVGESPDLDFDGEFLHNKVTVNIFDDEVPIMSLTETDGWTWVAEGGRTDSYAIALTGSEPNVFPVTVQIVPNNAEVKLNGGAAGGSLTLTFTSGNWTVPQTVTVAADQDGDAEGDHTTVLSHNVSGGWYGGYPLGNLTVYIDDDETVTTWLDDMVLYFPFEGDILDYSGYRNNGTAVNSPTYAAGTKGQAMSFSGTNYATMDVVADDMGGYQNTMTWCMWVNFTSVTGTPAFISNHTGDTGSNLLMIEADATGPFVYEIAARVANSNVPVNDSQWHHVAYVRSGTTGHLYVDGIDTVTHTGTTVYVGNELWSLAQEWDGIVPNHTASNFYTGLLDDVVIWRRALSPLEIKRLALDEVTVPYGPGLKIVPAAIPLTVLEGGDPNFYTVALNTQPGANVLVTLDPVQNELNLGAGAGVNITLTFTTANWNTPQTVSVTVVDDSSYLGTRIDTINHSLASADTKYNGLSYDFDVQVIDNDVPTVTVVPTSLPVMEGESDTYTIVLNINPGANVFITIDPNGTPEANGAEINLGGGFNVPITLTFTTANWNTPRTVTVTVAEDEVLEDNRTARITHTPQSTGDYSKAIIDDMVVTILEDECGLWGYERMDFNRDCYVDIRDLAEFVSQWLSCTQPYETGCIDRTP